jgi:hypothetical protein
MSEHWGGSLLNIVFGKKKGGALTCISAPKGMTMELKVHHPRLLKKGGAVYLYLCTEVEDLGT